MTPCNNKVLSDRVWCLSWNRYDGTRIRLHFFDGFKSSLDLREVSASSLELKMSTVRTADFGRFVEVEDRMGVYIRFDSTLLRERCDAWIAIGEAASDAAWRELIAKEGKVC